MFSPSFHARLPHSHESVLVLPRERQMRRDADELKEFQTRIIHDARPSDWMERKEQAMLAVVAPSVRDVCHTTQDGE